MMVEVLEVPAESRTRDGAVAWGPWFCCAQRAGEVTRPQDLQAAACDWLAAAVPGTVASALQAKGRWDWAQPVDIDASDWWFRTTFQAPDRDLGTPCDLCFDGLATLAEVWLNGELLLTTDNMFRAYRVDVSSRLRAENELAIRFRSLTEELKSKRSRPRWKTNLVNHQQLRWHRTSLQGRIPGWSPQAPAIGPWGAIRLESSPVILNEIHLLPTVEGTTGVVTVRARLVSGSMPERVCLQIGSAIAELELDADHAGLMASGQLRIENAALWWPHTHGSQHLYSSTLLVETAEAQLAFPCPRIGFRKIEASLDGDFAIRVNDQPIYCRGACWTVSDWLTLSGTEEALRHDLTLARDAGANMLRVGGTMVYESDAFYRLCDELGILVWQDFMFANMDYPVEDPAFQANIVAEATQQLQRLAPHPCVAVYCGNSEIEQQAAMLGMPRELWRNSWFGGQLPRLCAAYNGGIPYLPSTPSGGVLPFHASSGVTHYYGLGAYLRSPGELRQADVKFTPECLGFANVPDPQTVDLVTGGALPATHSPQWKRRVPRDTGAGWDFEDVRDHYLCETYGVDPTTLRSWNMPRYLQLSRMVSGEMMSRAFAEWRSGSSHNQGGLVWFYKDLWPGAGWGVVDATGSPKAAYYFLKRVWNTRQLTLTDEGLNGLQVHLMNETTEDCRGSVEVVLLKEPQVVVARQERPIQLAGRSRQMVSADEILGGFHDVTYAYRFGPPQHDVVLVTWYDEQRQVVSEGLHLIGRREPAVAAVNVQAEAIRVSDDEYRVTLNADGFLHGVALQARGFLPDDNYFHLPPQRSKIVTFRARQNAAAFKVDIEALNLGTPLRVTCNRTNVGP